MTDLLKAPVIGAFLRRRHSRTVLQTGTLIVSVAMIAHGLFGPALAPKNLAATVSWVHFRGALALALLLAGNLFCMARPFMLVRKAARRLIRPRWNWPRGLRNKWLSILLFAAVLYSYELFDLWSSPWWTAWLIVGYFAAAVAVDCIFTHATFCKYVCPIGQFNFAASLLSPFEVTTRSRAVCDACATKDCIRGRRDETGLVTIQRGCELALFQPLKTGNMDCTFCLECVQACPHDNVGIISRLPAAELLIDPRRSGIGRFSQRTDIAALALVFTFGALLNAFGMVHPVYVLERWLAGVLRTSHEAPVLGIIFAAFLIGGPMLLPGGAGLLTKAAAGRSWLGMLTRYSYGLVPLGFGMWLAHYGFHFLTGVLTIVPLIQSIFEPFLGAARWRWTGLPVSAVQPIELGFLVLGAAGSLFVYRHLAEEDAPASTARVFVPWAAVCALLWCASVWLMMQPMEMRGLSLAG